MRSVTIEDHIHVLDTIAIDFFDSRSLSTVLGLTSCSSLHF